jgi:RHS repeat-associated protein
MPKTQESFTYDLDGNLTSDGRWTNHWDAENRLVSMESLTNGPAGSKLRLTFNYDPLSRRTMKEVETWTGSAWSLTASNRFLYDKWNLVTELSSSNSAIRTYTWGLDLSGSPQGAGGVGGLLEINDSTQGPQFASFDGNGNVCTLVSSTNGLISAQYEYNPFGQTTRSSGPAASANPMRFSTKYNDPETAMLYFGYRSYNPSSGRWLSRDPLTAPESVSESIVTVDTSLEPLAAPYLFANNTPVEAIDHLGLWPTTSHMFGLQLPIPETHQNAIRRQIMASTQLGEDELIMAAVAWVDSEPGSQDAGNSFMHAMRAPHQATADAKRLSNEYVRGHLTLAEKYLCQCPPDRYHAAWEFGQALHTIQDYTSPSHHFQVWKGLIPAGGIDYYEHFKMENYDPGVNSQLDRATRWLWVSFYACTYGAEDFPDDFFKYLDWDPPNGGWPDP